jgi:hypothetical protein
MPRARALVPSFSLAWLAACGDGASAGGPAPTAVAAPRVPVTVTFGTGSQVLQPGDTLVVPAVARDSSGTALPAARLTWTSSDPEVLAVNERGVVRAIQGGSATVTAGAGNAAGTLTLWVANVHDLDGRGLPRVLTVPYLDPARIARISRLRSGFGHDYGDDRERCRSMKHYLQPRADVAWGSLVVSAPAEGTVTLLRDEQTFGTQVHIRPRALHAATVILFHVTPVPGLAVGQRVAAGQALGTHVGTQTLSDIALRVETPAGSRLVSAFDAMTDAAFAPFAARGVADRAALVISRAERDAAPLACNGEAFTTADPLPIWVTLQ